MSEPDNVRSIDDNGDDDIYDTDLPNTNNSINSNSSHNHSDNHSNSNSNATYNNSTGNSGIISNISTIGLGLRYGIVTASLLNAAAVSATASARPLLFSDDIDTEDEVDEDVDPESLPSYDDSQREHQELLRSDPRQAQQRMTVIQHLKQN